MGIGTCLSGQYGQKPLQTTSLDQGKKKKIQGEGGCQGGFLAASVPLVAGEQPPEPWSKIAGS